MAFFRPQFGALRLCLLASIGSKTIQNGVWCALGASGLEFKSSNLDTTLRIHSIDISTHTTAAPDWAVQAVLGRTEASVHAVAPGRVKLISIPALLVFLASKRSTRVEWAGRALAAGLTFAQQLQELMAHADRPAAGAAVTIPDAFLDIVTQVRNF